MDGCQFRLINHACAVDAGVVIRMPCGDPTRHILPGVAGRIEGKDSRTTAPSTRVPSIRNNARLPRPQSRDILDHQTATCLPHADRDVSHQTLAMIERVSLLDPTIMQILSVIELNW